MRLKLRAALAAAIATSVGGLSLLAGTAPAFAGGASPAWEPDSNAAAPYGNIQLFDANGVVVTSGSTASQPFVWAAATTGETSTAAGTLATAYFRDPSSAKLPASWAGPQESNTTTFSPAPTGAGTPATLEAIAASGVNGTPIVQMHTAAQNDTIDYWAAHTAATLDPNTAYDYIIDMVIQTSGGAGGNIGQSTYWNVDIGFCPTGHSGSCSAAGVSIAPGTWQQLFPLQTTPATPTLTISHPGSQPTNTDETLNVTGAPTTPAGDIVFEDNGTAIATVPVSGTGTASFDAGARPNGTDSFTASFVPVPPSESNAGQGTAGQGTANQVASSTSAAQTDTISTPKENTTTALVASPNNNVPYGQSVQLSATVTENTPFPTGDTNGTNGLTGGTVTFYLGGTLSGNTVTGGTLVTPATGTNPETVTVGTNNATATITTTALPSGTDQVTAVFAPTSANSNSYNGSASTQQTVTVQAPPACSNTGSICNDQQNITVTVNPGTITISTPYTQANPFVLPPMTLSSDGTYLQSSATFPSPSTANSTNVTAASAGVDVTTFGTSGTNHTLNVVSTGPATGNSGFAPQGSITVATTNGSVADTAILTYTGITGTTFTGVTYSAGAGTIASNGAVTQAANQIVVTSTLSPAYAWTVSVSASPLTGNHGGTIDASGLGLTNGALLNASGAGSYPGTVTFTGIPALNPSSVDAAGTGPGLSSSLQTWAKSTAADGSAVMDGTLTLLAPTSIPPGTYSGSITFNVA